MSIPNQEEFTEEDIKAAELTLSLKYGSLQSAYGRIFQLMSMFNTGSDDGRDGYINALESEFTNAELRVIGNIIRENQCQLK